MDELLQKGGLGKLKEGSVVDGTIVEIQDKAVIVDIGAKAEGIINSYEFPDLGDIHIGEKIEVLLERLEDKDGRPVLSYDKAQQKKNWQNIMERCQEGSIVSGRVKSKVKGGKAGLMVNIGVDAFLPVSQVDTQAPKNLDYYIGQTLDMKVVKIDLERKNIVVSRRELIEEQRQQKRKELLDQLEVGSRVRGVVKNLVDFGAFIDLGGLDALLPSQDISWGRIAHPREILKVGEEIEVYVTEVDKEKGRISLGLKQLRANPWDQIEARYPKGTRVRGKVISNVAFGCFVELETGVEGLVHASQFSWGKRAVKPLDFPKVGDEIDAVILDIQKDKQRISLSFRELDENPWTMAIHNYPVGAHIRGKVRNMAPHCAFIELEEGIDGVVYLQDMSWTRKINHPSEIMKKGDDVDAIVLSVDAEKQRIALGIKQLSVDPWKEVSGSYKVGDIVEGVVTKIIPNGVFVRLKEDIDGFVHISQLAEGHVDKVKDVLNQNDPVVARVIKVDHEARRIGLSIKAAHYDSDRLAAETAAYESLSHGETLSNFGDIFERAQNDAQAEAARHA